jgi:predicted RNA binding protein YcfA (HicA-like mRNA interferase family)
VSHQRKLVKQMITLAEAQGWRVVRGRSCHWKFYDPAGNLAVTCSGSPTEGHRSLLNTIAQLRQAGIKIPRPDGRKKT